MCNAIKTLRSAADDCEIHARVVKEPLIKAEVFNITAMWHYLAGEAAKLHLSVIRQFETDRHFEKRGSGSSGLEFKQLAIEAATTVCGLRWWQV